MRTSTLRTVAARIAAASLALAAVTTAASAPVWAADAAAPAAPGGDRIFDARAEAGYQSVDVEGSLDRLSPYAPLPDGPVLGLDLLSLTPRFGSLRLESGFLTGDNWRADAEYNLGAKVDVEVGTQAFTHDTGHAAPPGGFEVPTGFGEFKAEGADADPGELYRTKLNETTAKARVRFPGYPAHLRASGRILTRRGDEQMQYFYRSCSTELCHVNSRTRDLDQETREYTLGFDAHVGFVDVAYSHAVQTFRDEAADPLVSVGDMRNGLAAGDYERDVNPDLRSYNDRVTLNTNLTNRVVLSTAYNGGKQENESSDVARRTRNAGATLSWRPAGSLFLVSRYTYDEVRSVDLGAEALALREKNNKAHANYTHQHVLDPEQTRHTAELAARFTPVAKADVGVRLRYRTRERHTLIEKEAGAWDDEFEKTRSTLASLDGRLRPLAGLSLEASLGYEWSHNPLYSVETTDLLRYGLGGTWTPSSALMLRASWQGYRTKNDDPEALQYAYAGTPALTDPERTTRGDSFSLLATVTPAATVNVTLSWTLADNDVEQDMIFGSVSNYGYSFLSPDTSWEGRSQVASLQARWEVGRRLTLTAGGSWVDGIESYNPDFEGDGGLEEVSRVEFTKMLGSLEAELRVAKAVNLTVAAFWAKYDDQVDDAEDATARGLIAAVGYRW